MSALENTAGESGKWTLLQELSGHQGAVYDLARGEEGDLWSVGGDGWMVRWPAQDGAWSVSGEAMARTEQALFALDVVQGQVLAGGADGGLVQWTQEGITILSGHQGGTYCVQGEFSGGADGKLRLWKSGKTLGQVQGRIRCVANHNGHHWVGTHDGRVHHMEGRNSQSLHEGSLRAILKWPGKDVWGTAGGDGSIRVWKASDAQWELLVNIDAHKGSVYRLLPSPDGRYVASVSRDRSIAIWHADTLELHQRLSRPTSPGHTRSVNALCFLDPHTLASAGDDGRILIWGLKST